jgi:hypothetical protein
MLVGLICLVAGCAEKKPETTVPFAATADAACYTVDLFGKVAWKRPAEAVPASALAFHGRWGGGKWDGAWCHDLYVLDVREDGTAQVIETYAPLPAWGKRATAFRRTARIDRDGRLRMAYGEVAVEYWIEDGKLFGLRTEGGTQRRIMLSRQAV